MLKERTEVPYYVRTWGKPGRGKAAKKAYNRAVRRAAKGTGKTRAVARLAGELDYGPRYPGGFVTRPERS